VKGWWQEWLEIEKFVYTIFFLWSRSPKKRHSFSAQNNYIIHSDETRTTKCGKNIMMSFRQPVMHRVKSGFWYQGIYIYMNKNSPNQISRVACGRNWIYGVFYALFVWILFADYANTFSPHMPDFTGQSFPGQRTGLFCLVRVRGYSKKASNTFRVV
jgi:hypothetical protein